MKGKSRLGTHKLALFHIKKNTNLIKLKSKQPRKTVALFHMLFTFSANKRVVHTFPFYMLVSKEALNTQNHILSFSSCVKTTGNTVLHLYRNINRKVLFSFEFFLSVELCQ